MSERWLEEAVEATGLLSRDLLPGDLLKAVPLRLPLSLVPMSQLSTHRVHEWLKSRGVEHIVNDSDRALHGCLVARAGRGLVFFHADDDATEIRFTIAHEVAHFVLDHLQPRFRALQMFGEKIRAVLDGTRPPTRQEMLSAVLSRTPLDLQVHLMSRGPDNAIPTWAVEESEQRADRLALELLAPLRQVVFELDTSLGRSETIVQHSDRAAALLAERFCIPPVVARSYLQLLASQRRRRQKLSETLIGGQR